MHHDVKGVISLLGKMLNKPQRTRQSRKNRYQHCNQKSKQNRQPEIALPVAVLQTATGLCNGQIAHAARTPKADAVMDSQPWSVYTSRPTRRSVPTQGKPDRTRGPDLCAVLDFCSAARSCMTSQRLPCVSGRHTAHGHLKSLRAAPSWAGWQSAIPDGWRRLQVLSFLFLHRHP